jgi:hypothetical protein
MLYWIVSAAGARTPATRIARIVADASEGRRPAG